MLSSNFYTFCVGRYKVPTLHSYVSFELLECAGPCVFNTLSMHFLPHHPSTFVYVRHACITYAYTSLTRTQSTQVIVDDGAVLSAALNAATMALLNAGVEMTGIALSVTCCITSSLAGRSVLLDPCKSEEGEAAATAAVATLSAGGGVLSCRAVGLMSPEEYFACCEAAAQGTTAVRSFVRLSAEQKVNREAETLR